MCRLIKITLQIMSYNKFKSEVVRSVLKIEMRKDKLGNLFYFLEWIDDCQERYVTFEKMSSVIDFINSNFGRYVF